MMKMSLNGIEAQTGADRLPQGVRLEKPMGSEAATRIQTSAAEEVRFF